MILIVILVLILIPASITLIGIYQNVGKMAKAYSTTYYFPSYPTPNIKGKTKEQIELIKRGDYLVKAGDCIACHTDTASKGQAFAGGLAMQTAFGAIYSPNITSDKKTGIGNWTDEQFIKAMHEGISPSGEYYYPAFPYLYFNLVTVPDLKAIKAYLDSIPAIYQENRENDMVWPFNWRFLQIFWRFLFFNPNDGPFKPTPNQSPAWNRGAYLVEGLGHCAMCHTPSYYIISEDLSLGAPIRKYNLTGAYIQGYVAPNITKANLGAIPDNELLKIFTDYNLLGGGKLQGPMLEAVHDSLIHLTTGDLLAMIAYLKTLEITMPEELRIGRTGLGESIYNSYCSGCHATGVGGAPKLGDAASWGPLARSGMQKLYTVAIRGGGNMPAKGTCIRCSDQQIKEAVDFMVAASINPPKQEGETQNHP